MRSTLSNSSKIINSLIIKILQNFYRYEKFNSWFKKYG